MAYTNPTSYNLLETDIRMFLRERPNTSNLWSKAILSLALLFGFSALMYGALNYNALLRIFSPTQTVVVIESPLPVAPNFPAETVKAAAIVAPTPTPTPEPAPTIPESTLSFGSLNISAPISWDTSFDDALILKTLPNSLVHFQGTAKPGQQGYVVITGHSSNYPWIKGQYNSIFAPLQKATAGETVLINYKNREYTYKVTKSYVVKPTDVDVLGGGTGSGLRLITCTPIGTSLRRLVVEAEQVSPDPSLNTPFQTSVLGTEIPAAR